MRFPIIGMVTLALAGLLPLAILAFLILGGPSAISGFVGAAFAGGGAELHLRKRLRGERRDRHAAVAEAFRLGGSGQQ